MKKPKLINYIFLFFCAGCFSKSGAISVSDNSVEVSVFDVKHDKDIISFRYKIGNNHKFPIAFNPIETPKKILFQYKTKNGLKKLEAISRGGSHNDVSVYLPSGATYTNGAEFSKKNSSIKWPNVVCLFIFEESFKGLNVKSDPPKTIKINVPLRLN